MQYQQQQAARKFLVGISASWLSSNSLFTPPTRTRPNCLVLSVLAVWTELATRRGIFVLSRVSTQFPICNCSVSNLSKTTENLQIGNWVETRQNCLVLSAVVFIPPTRTRQDSLVCPGRPCEHAIILGMSSALFAVHRLIQLFGKHVLYTQH